MNWNFFLENHFTNIWATSWQNQQNGMCAQWRLRSAWACAQSDQSSLSAWRKLGSLATHWAHSQDSDQTGQIPRLIWVFSGCTVILCVLSWGGSFLDPWIAAYAQLSTPQPLYNTIFGILANIRVGYPIRVISRVKCLGIGKGVF